MRLIVPVRVRPAGVRAAFATVVTFCVLALAPTQATATPFFDGQRALDLVARQCSFGPRNPGSPGHAACLAYLEAEMRAVADSVHLQPYVYALPGREPFELANVVASFQPENPSRILLAAHWDTRPWADLDSDSLRRSEPILGANDGASGVAVLLELARALTEEASPYGVDIVFFDGEDLGTPDNPGGFFTGSKEFCRRLGAGSWVHALLLDMVGDRDLQFYREGNSVAAAPHTVDWVWRAGREVSPTLFLDSIGYFVDDDHLPLIAAGVPCADLIDFDYPYWHTTEDTVDKVSAASLQVVGDVLIRLLYP